MWVPLICVAVCLQAASGYVVKREARTISLTTCDGHPNDSPLEVEDLEISPYPVQLPKAGKQGLVHITLKGSNSRTIPNMDMEVEIKKSTIVGDLPIPCILEVGSCTYDNICHRIQNSTDEFTREVLNMVQQGGVGPGKRCPFTHSQLQVTDFPLHLPEFPRIPGLGSLVSGIYKIKTRMINRGGNHDGEVLACFQVEAEVVEMPEPEPEVKTQCSGWFCSWRL